MDGDAAEYDSLQRGSMEADKAERVALQVEQAKAHAHDNIVMASGDTTDHPPTVPV